MSLHSQVSAAKESMVKPSCGFKARLGLLGFLELFAQICSCIFRFLKAFRTWLLKQATMTDACQLVPERPYTVASLRCVRGGVARRLGRVVDVFGSLLTDAFKMQMCPDARHGVCNMA